LTCCACALSLPRCSSGGRYGRAEQEGRNPASPPPSATRQRCPAHEPPPISCRWLASSLPCLHAKGCHFVGVPEKKGKTIPVLTPAMHRGPEWVIRGNLFRTNSAHLLAMSGSSTPGFEALPTCQIRRNVRELQGR
jgi:hypothetical protein